MPWTIYQSPIGPLTLVGGSAGLRRICFPAQTPALALADHDAEALGRVAEQLDQYFAGERRTFALDLDLIGGSIRQRVWSALLSIPYGETTTYGSLARQLDVGDRDAPGTGSRPASAAQRVARVIAATPTPTVVPCHRVIAADGGSLTGYLGGLERKQALLDFEASGGAVDALRRGNSFQLTLL